MAFRMQLVYQQQSLTSKWTEKLPDSIVVDGENAMSDTKLIALRIPNPPGRRKRAQLRTFSRIRWLKLEHHAT